MNDLQSFTTLPDAARTERMNGDFLKLHPGAVIHYFTDARDELYHDHPFAFTTHVILGGYREEVITPQADGSWCVNVFERRPGTSHKMPAGLPHRLTALLDGPCITRCEYGPTVQRTGFYQFDERGQLLHRFWDEHNWNVCNPENK